MVDALRNQLRRLTGLDELPVDSDTGAWLASLVVHLALLLSLTGLTMLLPAERVVLLTASPLDDEPLPPEEFRFANELQEEIGALSDAGADDAAASAELASLDSEVVLDVRPVAELGTVQAFEPIEPIAEAPQFSDNRPVKGVGSIGATGAEGAVDRITNEVLLSLEQRPTLVLWLFDRSLSLAPQREKIAQRFDRVYEELGLIADAGRRGFRGRGPDERATGDGASDEEPGGAAKRGEPPLLTTVASFGEGLTLLTPRPTDDLDEIKSAVRAIADDTGGNENVFTAIGRLVERHRRYRLRKPRRNVLLVVFTDEAGNDAPRLEDTVALCRKLQTRVYVIGSPAPFGREQALVKYIDPEEDPRLPPRYLPVDQGPESIVPERVRLDFLGDRGGRAVDIALDSGFGPFGLSRLAYETGGVFFAVHPNRRTDRPVSRNETEALTTHLAVFFEPRRMRRYRPNYFSAEEYRGFVSRNRARAALVEAAGLSRTGTLGRVQLTFAKRDEAQLAESLTRAQRTAARLEPKVNQLVATLRAGEKDRGKITTPRWQAGYDLAIGRALATKVRVEGYNTMLAHAKQGMKFKNERSDTWVLRTSDTISTGSVLAKQSAQATAYLRRVLDDHPETPWALLAERELATPFGWEWREEFRNVAEQLARRRANRNRPRPERPAQQAPPRTPAPKL